MDILPSSTELSSLSSDSEFESAVARLSLRSGVFSLGTNFDLFSDRCFPRRGAGFWDEDGDSSAVTAAAATNCEIEFLLFPPGEKVGIFFF